MEERRLFARRLSEGAERERAALFERAARVLGEAGELRAVWAPGRIEVLGKHVDYGGGRSIVAAVERGFAFVYLARADQRFSVTDADSRQRVECELATEQPQLTGWGNYVATVVRRIARDFPLGGTLSGADVAFASNLPAAAGLSSSSALVVGLFLVLSATNYLSEAQPAIGSREQMAEYAGAMENGRAFGPFAGDHGVGTLGGNQDQTAILCCEAGRISRFGYLPARREGTLEMPGDLVFVVGSSGVEAAKTGGAMERYNRASRLLARVLEVANRASGRGDATLMAALGRVRAAVAREGDVALAERFEHFVAEVFEIVPGAWEAWGRGDWDALGGIVDRSQEGAELMLGNQVPETVYLARRARELGAVAASAFGAGFGGSVWALVRRGEAEGFMRGWWADYAREFAGRAGRSAFFVTEAGPAAFET